MPRLNDGMRQWLMRRAAEREGDVRDLARALLELDGGEPAPTDHPAWDNVDRLRERVLGLKGQVASLERERDLALDAAAKDAKALVERVRECNELRDEVADLAARCEHARAEHEAQLGALQAALEDRANWNTYEHGRLYGMAIAAHKAERVMAQEAGPRAAGAEAVRDAIFYDDAQARAAVMRWQQAERDCETISALVAARIPCKGTAIERVRMVLAALDMSTTKRGAS